MTPKLCSRVCRLTAVRLRISAFVKTVLKSENVPLDAVGNGSVMLRDIAHGEQAALAVGHFADVLSGAGLGKSFKELRGKAALQQKATIRASARRCK